MKIIAPAGTAQQWTDRYPVPAEILAAKPILWINPHQKSFAQASPTILFQSADVEDAAARLDRFRPCFMKIFPETIKSGGLIESPLQSTVAMQRLLEQHYGMRLPGRLMVKMDSHLPVAGSIKARGGIYAVARFAEQTAIACGLLQLADDYSLLDSPPCRTLFSRYSLIVGSTGNLALSIGIAGAALGFMVIVHMSRDAKAWKKELLRASGVTVVEHDGDYSTAVAAGRRQALADPHSYFIDDENSPELFLGYAVAAGRLQKQLAERSIAVDSEHPLLVYLPCGVGGGPSGISFGLKLIFGDNVHCFFGEPTASPAMLAGLATGLDNQISTDQLGIENRTCADGLAVSSPSRLACQAMRHLLTGVFTADDAELYRLLALLAKSETIRLEPSAVIGFAGLPRLANSWQKQFFSPAQQQAATHLVWATGGSMVPESVWLQDFLEGEKLLAGAP